MNDPTETKVAIIGSGPAGCTSAIYTGRANLRPLLFTGLQPGGQLNITNDVENFPGFENGINGPALMKKMQRQAERFGTTLIQVPVDSVDFSTRPFKLKAMEKEYLAESVIVATGASAKFLGLESEMAFKGRGVSACATCDGPFYQERTVLVVGGGDTAMEEANHLSKFASRVYVAHRRDELRAGSIMQERVLRDPKVEMLWNTVIVEVLGDETGVTGARLRDTKTGEEGDIRTDGIFMAIGHRPNTEIFKGQLELDEQGYIVAKPGGCATSVEGVFAAGDVQDSIYMQAISAAGTGCMAAIEADRWLVAKGL